jgi:hypothetical protein
MTVQDALVQAPSSTLAECEEVIEHGLKYFIEVGLALITIRDRQLYRASHRTFEDYCRKRWGLARPRAYALMDAAHTTQQVSEISDIAPTNEAQAKALSGLEPEVMVEVMAKAAESGKVTAAVITAARRQVVRRPPGRIQLRRARRQLSQEEKERQRILGLVRFERGTLRDYAPDLLEIFDESGGDQEDWDRVWGAWHRRSNLSEAVSRSRAWQQTPMLILTLS